MVLILFYEGKKIRHSKIWWAFFFQKFFFILIFHHHLLKSIISVFFFLQLLCCNAHFFFDFVSTNKRRRFFRELFYFETLFVTYRTHAKKSYVCVIVIFWGKIHISLNRFFFHDFFCSSQFFFQRFFSIRVRKGTISFVFLD